jgi:hypothetical protein
MSDQSTYRPIIPRKRKVPSRDFAQAIPLPVALPYEIRIYGEELSGELHFDIMYEVEGKRCEYEAVSWVGVLCIVRNLCCGFIPDPFDFTRGIDLNGESDIFQVDLRRLQKLGRG